MKKEWAFTALMTIGGIFAGFAIASFFIFVINPGLSPYLLTLDEAHDAELMMQRVDWITDHLRCILAAAAFLAATGFLFLLINLNSHITKALFKSKTATQKFIAVIGVEIVLIYLLFALDIIAPMDNLLQLYGDGGVSKILLVVKFASIFLIGGLFWIAAGEMGWAGDFSSWTMNVKERKRDLTTGFLLGGVIGLAGAFLYVVNDWIFREYFILVSAVLDKSSQASFTGMQLITYELMLMTALSLGIMAGLVVALAPVYRDTKTRLYWLIYPGVLLLIGALIVLPAYYNAVNTYDFGKDDLAEAAGIPDTASRNKTVLFIRKNNKVMVQQWPLQVEYYTTAATHAMAVSYKNLDRIKGYLDQHKEGSVFQYAAEETLYKGYFVLWDTRRALERQYISAKHMIVLRMMLLSRMPALPVTPTNIAYLNSFTDEAKWQAGAEAAIDAAKGFVHFGRIKQARKWLARAKELNADPSAVASVKIPRQGILTTGGIFGRITVNDSPLKNARVGLFTGTFESRTLTHWELATRILEVRKLGSDGEFTFGNLGQGEYSLAIMTDTATVPFDIPLKSITLPGLPSVITINTMLPAVDLGTIDIVF